MCSNGGMGMQGYMRRRAHLLALLISVALPGALLVAAGHHWYHVRCPAKFGPVT